MPVEWGNGGLPGALVVVFVVLAPLTGSTLYGTPTESGAVVEDDITGDTRWTAGDSPVRVSDDVTVGADATLTVEDGTTVEFETGVTLTINGTMRARGTPSDRVRFRSTGPTEAAGDWGTIRFTGGTNTSLVLDHVVVTDATNGITTATRRGDLIIENSTVQQSSGAGILGTGGAGPGSVRISETVVTRNGNGIRHGNGTTLADWRIENNTIWHSAESAVDLDGTGVRNVTVVGNDVRTAGRDGVAVSAEGGDVALTHVTVGRNTVRDVTGDGVAVAAEGGDVALTHVTVEENSVWNTNGDGVTVSAEGGNAVALTVTVHDNTVRNAGKDGVTVVAEGGNATANTATVGDNSVRSAGRDGVAVAAEGGSAAAGNTTIRENVITNSTTGIRVASSESRGEGSTVDGNRVFANAVGVFVDGPQAVTLSQNHVGFNEEWGVTVSRSVETTARENNIYGNRFGMAVTDGARTVAESNYWGASSGPFRASTNTGGEGNPVVGDRETLDVNPFLAEPVGDPHTAPVANLTVNTTSVEMGEPVSFDARNSTTHESITEYRFDFGDGNSTGWSARSTVVYGYPQGGTYRATLHVRDSFGIRSQIPAAVTTNVGTALAPPVDEYDANSDRRIDITELGRASTAYVAGEITVVHLGAVAAAYASRDADS